MRMDWTQFPVVRTALGMALAALMGWPGTAAGQAPTKTLVITEIRPIPLNGPGRAEEGGSIYYLVEATYPQDWQDEVENTFKVKVDGLPATYQDSGSGFGGGEADRSFWVYLGSPGKKTIEVTLVKDGKTIAAEKEFTVPAESVIRLLDHYDGEAVFENEALKFVDFGALDVSMKVNGVAVDVKTEPVKGFEGVSMVTVPPSLKPGMNTIEYASTNAEAKQTKQTIQLYYASGNKAKVGDHFLFTYGRMGSKSGPFYNVMTDGAVLVQTGQTEWKIALKMDEKGWVGGLEVFGHPIEAKKAGTGGLALFVKSNFMLPEELDKKIAFTVEP